MTTALLSVYDKAGVTELATGLHELGWRLISSGGTAKAIAGAGLPVTDVAELTGFPAILGHRVVTLHPAVHAGLLADLDQPEHRAELAELGIEPIALLVANLYPFATQPGIELIDVGGPAMIRAAAKNHAHVGVVVDPAQYGPVLDELREAGALSAETRRRLAQQAFARTAAYDTAIAGWMAGEVAGASSSRASRDDDRGAGAGAGPALRREPAPAGRPLPDRRRPQLVGRRRAARRQGAVVPQPLRHRGGVAAGPPLRGTGRRHRQARQPVRGRGRRATSPTRTSRPTRATPSRPSVASWPPTVPCPRRWPRRWPRCSRRSSWRRRSPTTPCPCSGPRRTSASCRRRPRTATRSTCAASTVACSPRTSIGSRSTGPGGRCRPWRSPTRPCGGSWPSRGRSARR